MMIKVIQKIALLVLVSVTLVGCGAGSEVEMVYTEAEVHSQQQSNLSVEVTLLDRFHQPSDVFLQGEPIELSLSVTNHSDDVVIFDFSSAQQYDFYVDAWFGQVWAWSDNKLFGAAPSQLDIPPRSTVTVSEYVDSDGFNRGSYTATGVFVTQGLLASVDFRVD